MSPDLPDPSASCNKKAALKGLYDELYAKNMFPFWATSDTDHDEVKQLMATSKAVPFVWRYTDIEPLLQRAAQLVTMDDSERRSLILCNPGLAPRRASVSTMYTAWRLNDPDEIMPPHKHSPSAKPPACCWRRSVAAVIRSSTASATTGPSSTRWRCLADAGWNM